MIWKAVEEDDLMTEAEALTVSLAKAPTAALTRMKLLFAAAGTNTLLAQMDLERGSAWLQG